MSAEGGGKENRVACAIAMDEGAMAMDALNLHVGEGCRHCVVVRFFLVGGLGDGKLEVAAGHAHEEILNVEAVLCRGLQEGDVLLVGESLTFVMLDHTLILEIRLVSDNDLVHLLVTVLLNLTEPVLDVVEGLLVGDVINEDVAVSSAVVRLGDGTEALLASSIPLR